MTRPDDDEVQAFLERNIDMLVAGAERGFSGSGAGVVLVHLTADGGIPDTMHASYSPVAKLRNGVHDVLADLAEEANSPDEAAIVLVLPSLAIVDYFICNVVELQSEYGDPNRPVTFYHPGDLN